MSTNGPPPRAGRRPAGAAACALVVALAACAEEDAAAPPTYHRDVAPLVDRHCVSCHRAEGIAPFALERYEDLRDAAPFALREIEAGRMPPWMPDPDCHPLREERVLTEAEKATFRAWVEAGAPEGDPATAPPPEGRPDRDFPVTHALTIGEPYTPDGARDDDYRCFLLDVDLDQDAYLRGIRVRPQVGALVHHVLLYALEPSQREALEAADAAEPGPGYTCFGSPLPGEGGGAGGLVDTLAGAGFALPQTLGGWVPGMQPSLADPGTATRLRAGTPLVVQMHYNLLTADPAPDETAIDLVLDDTPPEQLVVTRPAAILDLDIPAGEPRVVHAMDFTHHGEGTLSIRGLTAHMHLLGQSFRTTVVRADGREECLLDIPDWDFAWQQNYALPMDAPVELAPGDGFRLECVHDNSRENQPFVNGVQLPPDRVRWGDGSLDEMCLLYFEEVRPWAPPAPPVARCAAAPDCLRGCAPGDEAGCLLSCDALDFGCALCTVQGFVECGVPACALPFVAAQECLTACATNSLLVSGSTGDCLTARCPGQWEALRTCLGTVSGSAACTAALEACGVP